MASNTRIPRAEITGFYGSLLKRYSKRMLGEVAEPAEVMWHNRKVLKDMMSFGQKVREWSDCDPTLKSFAHLAVSAQLGCSWCLDFGYFHAHNEKLDIAKASQVPRWRESEVFTPLERDVMEYAEAMSQAPPAVTDEQSARLLEALGAPAMVELTAWIAYTNQVTRINIAFGIESQGFSAACEVPLAKPSRRMASSI